MTRAKTFAFCGGAFGDEGKGRIVDMVVEQLSQQGPVAVYRDNGGANAGHTVELANGQRVAFHQLPSAIFVKGATVILGKEMVLHPADLVEELKQVEQVDYAKDRAEIVIDEMACLSLDTHRAYENVLKTWQSGGKGATGRGIAPAYADVLLRHPLRMRDLIIWREEKIRRHYQMYDSLIKGLGYSLADVKVQSLEGKEKAVGSEDYFVSDLQRQTTVLRSYVKDISGWLQEKWANQQWGFVFEKAQAVGLDVRWGVYPDVTASDTTFAGILSATEGVVDPQQIQYKAGVIKATYMSSVGARQLPTILTNKLADRIREDAHEYGATTKRPRDIALLDLPALRFYAQVGRFNALVLTHMDISYPGQTIKVCVDYQINDHPVPYRPDQEYLNLVSPFYREFQPWDVEKLRAAKSFEQLPTEAQVFLKFIEEQFALPVLLITTGPRREQGLWLQKW